MLALAELLAPSDEQRVTHVERSQPVTSHAPQVTILSGIGGVGKTQLAVEFAYRYGRFFHSVHWLSLADPAAAAAEAIACGEALGLPLAGRPVDEAVALTRRAWAGPPPRLLIFDNCEDPALLRAWRPPPGGARVLITSRHSAWPPETGAAGRPLLPLPRAASLALLRRYLANTPRRESDAALGRVAAAVGDLPLALALAGHYLARYRSQSLDAYLAALAAADDLVPVGRDALSLTGHPLSLRRTFAVSYDRLRPAAGDDGDEAAIKTAAVALLARAACLAPGEPIPAALLAAALAADPPALADEARERLLALGLLEPVEAGESFRLHRLLARFVAKSAPPNAQEGQGAKEEAEGMAAARAAVERAVIDLAYEQNTAGDPRALRAWEAHLRHVTDAARDRDDDTAATLCGNLGYYLQMGGDLAGARPYFERALAISERVLGPQHPDTALSLNNLGALLDSMGDLAGARPYFERALDIYERALGPQHPDTALSLNNLGALLDSMGDLAGARPYFERALAIRERVLGPQHPDTARSLNNLGYLLQAQGDLAGARPTYERALDIRERALGPQHPDTAISYGSLGSLIADLGDVEQGRMLLRKALVVFQSRLGPNHPHTQETLRRLAVLDSSTG